MSREETISATQNVIDKLRQQYGQNICTDPVIDGDIMSYTIMPDDTSGYIREINLETGKSRHHGNGKGCFWTEWE